MKKFTFFAAGILSLLLAGRASAQIQQGNILMGGDLANFKIGLSKPNVIDLNLTPTAAWFVQDNFALGGYVNIGLATAKGSSTTTTYGLGALGRYYTGQDVQVLKHGRFFGEATFGFGGTSVSDGGGNTNGIDFSFGPGFAYFITPSIGLETLVKYNGLGGFGDVAYQSNINLTFGFQIYLPGKNTARKVKSDMR